MNEEDNGGYMIQTVPHPNSVNIEDNNIIYDKNKINIEKLFILGYITSGDPWNIGNK